jgi:hypothetical protein
MKDFKIRFTNLNSNDFAEIKKEGGSFKGITSYRDEYLPLTANEVVYPAKEHLKGVLSLIQAIQQDLKTEVRAALEIENFSCEDFILRYEYSKCYLTIFGEEIVPEKYMVIDLLNQVKKDLQMLILNNNPQLN